MVSRYAGDPRTTQFQRSRCVLAYVTHTSHATQNVNFVSIASRPPNHAAARNSACACSWASTARPNVEILPTCTWTSRYGAGKRDFRAKERSLRPLYAAAHVAPLLAKLEVLAPQSVRHDPTPVRAQPERTQSTYGSAKCKKPPGGRWRVGK